MKAWSARDAKARFGELLEACLTQGPQLVIKDGTDAAVLVPIEEWRRLHGAPTRSLKELLLTEEARGELRISARGRHRRRLAPRFD